MSDLSKKRVMDNDCWHIWAACGTGQALSSNHFFHHHATRHILDYYRNEFRLIFDSVGIFSDGCAEQYKNRYNAYYIGMMAFWYTSSLKWFIHNYAPTASFKVNTDGQGFLTKTVARNAELNEDDVQILGNFF